MRTTNLFPANIWPPSFNHWMNPRVEQSLAFIPKPWDVGALRVNNSIYEILQIDPQEPAGYKWIPYDLDNFTHFSSASFYNRYGRGWSFGPASNLHDEVVGWFRIVYGIELDPNSMQRWDIEHNQTEYNKLKGLALALTPPPVNPPNNPPPVNPPPTVPPIIPPKPPEIPPVQTTNVERRTGEILQLIGITIENIAGKLGKSFAWWLKPSLHAVFESCVHSGLAELIISRCIQMYRKIMGTQWKNQ